MRKRVLAVLVSLLILIPLLLVAVRPNLEITSFKLIFNAIAGRGIDSPTQNLLDERLQVPSGFHLNRYAGGIPGARMLLYTDAGDLLVSQPRNGSVLLLTRDKDADGIADHNRTLLQKLNRPHGLALWQGWLYVAEQDAIGRVAFDVALGRLTGEYSRVIEGLPEGGNHWSKTIGFGADGWLYVSIGSTCNVCIEQDERRATLMRFRPDGGAGELFATGLRNSVGFDWAPWDGALYATDNGRDWLGDDYPPCELNRIEAKRFYG